MNARAIAEATSIRGAIASIIPAQFRVIEMKVLEEKPLKLQDVSDDKLILEGPILILPESLSDYELDVEIETETEYDYVHHEPHKYKTDKIKVLNHLKKGEIVLVFQVRDSRKFIIFDRRAQ